MDRIGKGHNIERKRGRPAGKNRIPLSREERRARNAQYERERRIETAEAFAELARALDCDPAIPHTELLATAIESINSMHRTNNKISELKSRNEWLQERVATLKQQLAEAAAAAASVAAAENALVGCTAARTRYYEAKSLHKTNQQGVQKGDSMINANQPPVNRLHKTNQQGVHNGDSTINANQTPVERLHETYQQVVQTGDSMINATQTPDTWLHNTNQQDVQTGDSMINANQTPVPSNMYTPRTSPEFQELDTFVPFDELLSDYDPDWATSQIGSDWLAELLPET